MAGQKQSVVPGIPLAALDAISDQNTRAVLQALVSAHQVRNNAVGNGDERFITAREAGLVKGYLGGLGGGSVSTTPGGSLISPGQIGRIINDLQAQVIESPLFKDLGERVDLIDKPGGIFDRLGSSEVAISNEITQRKTADTAIVGQITTLGARVGANEAAIKTETEARVNGDNAITKSVTTQFAAVGTSLALVQQSVTTVSNSVGAVSSKVDQVQASLGANSVAIQQESEARVNADGQMQGKYTVKIDNNGYVSGFGLLSTSNNSVPFSEFIFRADRFAIASPSGPGIAPKVPFIVLTQPGFAGGQVVPPGVYLETAVIMNGSIGQALIGDAAITTAKIGNAQITTAKIIDLAVDTLKLRGNAVTVPFVKTAFGTTPGGGMTVTKMVAEGYIDLDYPGMVYAIVTALIAYGTGWRKAETYLQINGTNLAITGGEEGYVNAANSGGVYCNAGRVYVRLYFRGEDSGVRIIDPVMFIQGAKK